MQGFAVPVHLASWLHSCLTCCILNVRVLGALAILGASPCGSISIVSKTKLYLNASKIASQKTQLIMPRSQINTPNTASQSQLCHLFKISWSFIAFHNLFSNLSFKHFSPSLIYHAPAACATALSSPHNVFAPCLFAVHSQQHVALQ